MTDRLMQRTSYLADKLFRQRRGELRTMLWLVQYPEVGLDNLKLAVAHQMMLLMKSRSTPCAKTWLPTLRAMVLSPMPLRMSDASPSPAAVAPRWPSHRAGAVASLSSRCTTVVAAGLRCAISSPARGRVWGAYR
jgi:hypothetical protein